MFQADLNKNDGKCNRPENEFSESFRTIESSSSEENLKLTVE